MPQADFPFSSPAINGPLCYPVKGERMCTEGLRSGAPRIRISAPLHKICDFRRYGVILPITVQHTQESLCMSHIYALAGMAGVNYKVDRYDYGVDGQFTPVTVRGNRRVNSGFPLDFQAKASFDWERRNGCIVYDLEAKNYNDIASRTPEETTLILILLCLPRDRAEWHVAEEAGTTLKHCC